MISALIHVLRYGTILFIYACSSLTSLIILLAIAKKPRLTDWSEMVANNCNMNVY
jgi:hypothetical protein